MPDKTYTLTPEQFEEFGARTRRDPREARSPISANATPTYIRGIIKMQRKLEVGGRALLFLPPAWPAGTVMLGLSKILDNMEIGHNVMHGQYDWMGDPALSRT